MNIFDFVTPEEIDDLPDNDPRTAFVTFVRLAQKRLSARVKELDGVSDGWRDIAEAQQGFMNVVVAAAKRFEIEPFASMEVPRVKDFDHEDDRQFRADLDHYMTQLVLEASSRARRDSVFITAELKDTIRTYIHHLRELIDKSDDIGTAKREILLRRLAEFEDELNKKRFNLLAVTMLVIAFAGAPGGIWSSFDAANRLVGSIVRTVGDAKEADDATRRLPAAGEPLAITGPRKEGPKAIGEPKRPEMDDEIPF